MRSQYDQVGMFLIGIPKYLRRWVAFDNHVLDRNVAFGHGQGLEPVLGLGSIFVEIENRQPGFHRAERHVDHA